MINYVEFAGKKVYKLRLGIGSIVELEKDLGYSPLMVFGTDGAQKIPTTGEMIAILHRSLEKYEHGISMKQAEEIFEEWLESGHTLVEFVSVIVEIYKVSGILPREEDKVKN